MTVRVLLFASYAEALGTRSIDLNVADGSVVGDVVAAVRSRAGAGRLPPAPAVAVNQVYGRLTDSVVDGDEVAIIPPVAGG